LDLSPLKKRSTKAKYITASRQSKVPVAGGASQDQKSQVIAVVTEFLLPKPSSTWVTDGSGSVTQVVPLTKNL
jgi:hypothetical protein